MNISITIWTLFAYVQPYTFFFWLLQLLFLYKTIKNKNNNSYIFLFIWSLVNVILFSLLSERIADHMGLIYLIIWLINIFLLLIIDSFKDRKNPIKHFFIIFVLFITTSAFAIPRISMIDSVYGSDALRKADLFSITIDYLATTGILISIYWSTLLYYKKKENALTLWKK